ncbi:MAG TPA: hypothetical protein VFU33_11165 [Gaiellaceae bacterium]|nr:hypothetical protein [Gaiellaceae bacterium]
MSRKKRMQNLREAKDRRAKKLALGLSVVLVAVLAFEVPKVMHHGSSSSSSAPATTTTGVSTTPTSAAPTTAPTTASGTAAAAGAPTTASLKLPNSDALPQKSIGQLYSFSHFSGKDPFVQQISDSGPGTAQTTGALTARVSGGHKASSAGADHVQQSGRTLAATGAARISVNGQVQVVRVGASFPSSNPLFRLVGASHGGARIGIANGSYSSGAHTVSLTLGRSLTLVDTADGVRYKIRLLSAS